MFEGKRTRLGNIVIALGIMFPFLVLTYLVDRYIYGHTLFRLRWWLLLRS